MGVLLFGFRVEFLLFGLGLCLPVIIPPADRVAESTARKAIPSLILAFVWAAYGRSQGLPHNEALVLVILAVLLAVLSGRRTREWSRAQLASDPPETVPLPSAGELMEGDPGQRALAAAFAAMSAWIERPTERFEPVVHVLRIACGRRSRCAVYRVSRDLSHLVLLTSMEPDESLPGHHPSPAQASRTKTEKLVARALRNPGHVVSLGRPDSPSDDSIAFTLASESEPEVLFTVCAGFRELPVIETSLRSLLPVLQHCTQTKFLAELDQDMRIQHPLELKLDIREGSDWSREELEWLEETLRSACQLLPRVLGTSAYRLEARGTSFVITCESTRRRLVLKDLNATLERTPNPHALKVPDGATDRTTAADCFRWPEF